MRTVIGSALLLGALACLPSSAAARGLLRARSDCCVDVTPGCCDCCDWVEKTVTCYRQEYRTRTVPHTVCKVVPREVEERFQYTELVREVRPEKRTENYCTVVTKQVPYTYTECVPVWTPEKRTETYCVPVTRQVPCTYTECVPVWTPEKRTETYCTIVSKQVPYTYTVCVPYTTPEKRQECYMECVPEVVTRQVTVCRRVPCEAIDPCTGCPYTTYRSVTETQDVKCVVNRLVSRTREYTVNVCHY